MYNIYYTHHRCIKQLQVPISIVNSTNACVILDVKLSSYEYKV